MSLTTVSAISFAVLGLHDRWFARHGFSAAELFRRRPDLIWMPHPDYTQMIRDILDAGDFWRDYDFYPDALTSASPSAATALRRLFAARFAADYPGFPIDDYRASRTSHAGALSGQRRSDVSALSNRDPNRF